jgi:predicted metal-dependent hydrolase
MPLDWTNGALAEGLRCYRAEEFFEAHEHWESVWLSCVEPEKTFLQALIQVTAAFHHLRRGNRAGAESLLNASLRRLESYPADFAGLPVESTRRNLRAWRDAFAHGNLAPDLPIPEIFEG